MRNRFKTLLCAAAILGSVSTGVVYADDISGVIDVNTEIENANVAGEVTISDSATLDVSNSFINDSFDVKNNGIIKVGQTFSNTGNINYDTASSVAKIELSDGTNSDSIIQKEITVGGTFTNNASGSIIADVINKGNFTNLGNIGADGNRKDLTNDGTFTNKGTILANDFTNNQGKTFTNNDTTNVSGAFSNSGAIDGTGSLTVAGGTNSGSLTQDSLTVGGTFTNNASGSIIADVINKGNFTNSGNIGADGNRKDLTNNGTFTNEGTILANDFTNNQGKTFTNNKTTNVSGTFSNEGTIDGTGSLTVAGGANSGNLTQDSLTVGGTFTNNASGSIIADVINNGTFTNSGNIGADGNRKNLTNDGTFTNEGTILANDFTNNQGKTFTNNNTTDVSGAFSNSGAIDGTGSLTVAGGTNSGNLTQDSLTVGGTFTNNASGSIIADVINNGNLTNDGSITSNNFTNSTGATFTNKNTTNVSGAFSNSGTIDGTGSLTVAGGTNSGSLTQDSLTVGGTFTNNVSGSIIADVINNGNFTNSGNIGADGKRKDLTNDGTFTNEGTILANDFTNNQGKTFTNKNTTNVSGNFTNSGTIDGTGSLTVADGTNSGSLTQDSLTVGGTFTNNANGSIIADVINNGNLTNNGSITSGNFTNNTGATFTNKNTTNVSGTFSNSGTIDGTGSLTVANGTNSGSLTQDSLTVGGTFTNENNIYVGDLQNNGIITNNGLIDVDNNLQNDNKLQNNGTINVAKNLNNKGSLTNTVGSIDVTENLTNDNNITNENGGSIKVTKTFTNKQNATLTNKTGSLIDLSAATANMANEGTVNNSGTIRFSENNAGLENKGNFTTSDGGAVENAIVVNTGTMTATNGSSLLLVSLDNINGTLNLNNSSNLTLTNQTSDLQGLINVVGSNKTSNGDLIANTITSTGNTANIAGTLNLGDAQTNTNLVIDNINIAEDANVNIEHAGKLTLTNNSTLNLNSGNNSDVVNGDINLENGIVNLKDYTLTTGNKSTQKGGSNAYYSQSGGTLNLNNSTLKLGDSSAIRGGALNIDSTSQFLVTSEENGTYDSFLDNLTIADGGRFGVMNGDFADYGITNINVDGTTNFTIDVYARSNQENHHGTDTFIGNNLSGSGLINIEDWTLAGDIFGWDAPIDRDIKLDNVFNYNNISPNIKLSATKKEVFTPIGWYQLNNHGGMNGNYTLNLTRFNPQVYRGQVTTLSQYMNQLAIDDMLFNHSMLLPSFKDDDLSENGTMANRYAAANPLYAPYQYSKKDGGLWYRMYGTFETLQMNQAGLGRVGNNAYGTIIGADFGLKDLKNGWKFMPTAYIGYNGAHQYFANMGAYQNGGQAGFLGTWYKDNFIIGGLVYGGIYQNSMDIAGHVDNTFNYFAGASAKGAYNWRFHRDWVLQPNLMMAYNFFGQQNWHSDFGQMGMMSGILNGINLAPGLNLIWEKETFSIYATLQYMYNLNGAVGGRAGNVDLPHLYMDRGYIQYGFGFTKRFTDRFSGYFQTVFRNVGRTGVGFQLGLNFKLGK